MAKVVCRSGDVSVECEATSPKDAFKKIAMLQDMMSEAECGCCHSPNIRFVVRTSQNKEGKDVEYYELKCQEPGCGAALSFGQHQNGATLFAKRWDKEARAPMPNGGWHIYVHNNDYQQGGYAPQPGYAPPQQGYPQQQNAPPRQQQQRPQQQGGWGSQQQPMAPPPPVEDIPF